jgi:hypothetical protein
LTLAAARANRGTESSQPIAGPLSELRLSVPMYQVTSRKNSQMVQIPGGETILIPGKPIVPFYTATVRFPKGQIVQNVTLKARSGLQTTTGLILPPARPKIDGDATFTATAKAPAGWWPDRDFDWSMIENLDGSRDVTIKAFAFFYNSNTTEARFYSNHVFGITWINSSVDIARLATEYPVYPAGALVKAHLTVQHSGTQPIDVVAETTVLHNETDVVEKLPTVPMPSLKTLGWTTLPWDTANRPGGDYILEVRIRDTAGNELDRARTEFQVGQADGVITSFDFNPRDYRVGDNVNLSATFANTGSTSLDGTVIIAVQDAAGNAVTEFRQSFSGLAAGAAFRFDTVWGKASLGPNDGQFLVYAQYGGQTTALSVFANWSETPLMWTSIAVSATEVQLTWSSTAGRNYFVDFTPELGTVPFSCIASNVVATPPQNTFRDLAQRPQGFYRLRAER